MKNIIIWGPVRSGKSYIARILKKRFSMNIIEIDCFKQAMEKALPKYDWKSIDSFEAGRIICKDLSEYIMNITHEANKYDEFFIFEGSSIDIIELCKSLDTSRFEMMLIAYPNETIEARFKKIRDYENHDDWTMQFSDGRLKSICQLNIENSHMVEKIAKEYDLLYFDVSNKMRDDVVKEIIDSLIKKGL